MKTTLSQTLNPPFLFYFSSSGLHRLENKLMLLFIVFIFTSRFLQFTDILEEHVSVPFKYERSPVRWLLLKKEKEKKKSVKTFLEFWISWFVCSSFIHRRPTKLPVFLRRLTSRNSEFSGSRRCLQQTNLYPVWATSSSRCLWLVTLGWLNWCGCHDRTINGTQRNGKGRENVL